MNWIEFLIIINYEVVELVINIFENYGLNGVVIEDLDDLIN